MAPATTRRKTSRRKRTLRDRRLASKKHSSSTTETSSDPFRWASLFWPTMLLLVVTAFVAFCYYIFSPGNISLPLRSRLLPASGGMLLIPSGRFSMGNESSPASHARPVHEVFVDSFWLDEHEVTNAQFARFVDATNYVTTAEQAGKSSAFDKNAHRWRMVPNANWKHPGGEKTTITGRDDQPVVQVSWDDAVAYCQWAGKRLPTEAEWERAARGSLFDADFPWGRKEFIAGRFYANVWQGPFPFRDEGKDGFQGIANIGSYPPNPFGLFDMAGNVAEWCADRYAEDYYSAGERDNPSGPSTGKTRVVRGGSWISAEINGAGYKVWVRDHFSPRESNNYTGFRCARDPHTALRGAVPSG